ncbi:hypothetical protein ABZ871_38800 [Streptomyces populi]
MGVIRFDGHLLAGASELITLDGLLAVEAVRVADRSSSRRSASCPGIVALTRHVRSLATILTERQGERLPAWLYAVRQDDLPNSIARTR